MVAQEVKSSLILDQLIERQRPRVAQNVTGGAKGIRVQPWVLGGIIWMSISKAKVVSTPQKTKEIDLGSLACRQRLVVRWFLFGSLRYYTKRLD